MRLSSLVPAPALSAYHFAVATVGAALYGFPSKRLIVIGVTGTKGKTSTTEYINAICKAAGWTTAVNNSIRSTVGDRTEKTSGRSMPGRARLQKFLADASREHCQVAIIEMTSEGARQHRHRGIALDCFVFLNLAPEHIESHGSFEKYADAKFELAQQLLRSSKRPRTIIANADDTQSARYLALPVERTVPFSLEKHAPWEARERGGFFTFDGMRMEIALPGEFSLKNALAAAHVARAFDISIDVIRRGLAGLTRIAGRAEDVQAGQDFAVIVDYAHTPDSLAALCDAYAGRRRITVLGSAGGGRDTWKRPVMGKVAEEHSEHVILTNDDPYDDDPLQIIREMEGGMQRLHDVIPDRRAAIRKAFSLAKTGDVVLITGKGIDPIYGPGGIKIPWNDADVARDELAKLRKTTV